MSATEPRTWDELPVRRREQKAWYWYEWAQSAFVTTVSVVLALPYLTSIANNAAGCPDVGSDDTCPNTVSLLGIPVSPGSAVFYVITIATVLSFLAMPVVGALADRSSSKKRWLAGYAWVGAISAALLFFVTGTNWGLGAVLVIIGNVCLIASLTVFSAILVDIAEPDERDSVSTKGWAFGYVGGVALLVISLAVITIKPAGLETSQIVRILFVVAGLWWAGFTVIPYLKLRDHLAENPDAHVSLGNSFRQLRDTLNHARDYPQTLRFLLAFLFFNDGVQTVIAAAAVYGQFELGMSQTYIFAAVILVNLFGIVGALLMGRIAARRGAFHVVMGALVVWMVLVIAGFLVPRGSVGLFLLLAIGIGLVVAGTQALSRSMYSQLIPRGREGEYFSLYQACERGTSWLGTLLFGIVHQLSGSYRWAIVALIVFFAVGIVLLRRVDMRTGVVEAGNEVPAVL
ncbi:MAG TPA: MFS transporter [Candidatus Nanopelagicales bacterium]|nr:MFS transporter [Candidatus Nanopelagicales bacterium]